MTGTRYDPAAHAQAMRESGFWVDRNYDEFLQATIAQSPNKLALLAYRSDRAEGRRISYAEFGELISRAAASLKRLGVGRGEVISVQLPNWWEFAVISLAAFRIGAIFNPLMPIFRERELGYMLDFSESKVLIVPRLFRGFDHEAMARTLRPALPKLKHVIVVDGEGASNFDALLLSGDERLPPPPAGEIGAMPTDEMAVLMFTSGTTGSPKGVMHCLNSLMACNIALAARFKLDGGDKMLVCSPLGHMTGFAAAYLLGLKIGASIIFQDIWEPKRGMTIMAEEGVSYSAGAATFLADMCEAVAAGAPKPAQLRKFLCAGAPIPSSLIDRVYRELDLQVCSLWGMSECLAGTSTEPERALEKSSKTDGWPLDGMAVKIQRLNGEPAPVGETGVLKVSGAQMFLGYYKRPEMEAFDAEGWFDTGDLAYLDDEGYIRIDGRIKDIIIRGGENVPIVEIENLLFKHPSVLAAALVGFPDSRLGERACAFVVLRPGHSLDLGAVQAYMAEHKVAKQYWPERVAVVPELPKTPAGKVQKYQLRERAKVFADTQPKVSA